MSDTAVQLATFVAAIALVACVVGSYVRFGLSAALWTLAVVVAVLGLSISLLIGNEFGWRAGAVSVGTMAAAGLAFKFMLGRPAWQQQMVVLPIVLAGAVGIVLLRKRGIAP